MQNEFIKKYDIGEFFNGIFKVLKNIWKDSLILSLIVFIPVSIIFSYGLVSFFSGMVSMLDATKYLAKSDTSAIIPYLIKFGAAMLIYTISMILYSLGTVFVGTFVSLKTFSFIKGQAGTIKDFAKQTFSKYFPKIILQNILLSLIFGGMVTIFYIVFLAIILVITIAQIFLLNIFLIILLVLLSIFFICFIIWFSYRVFFSNYSIIYEDLGIIKGIKKSFSLVKGNFWRVFGITLLIGMVISLVIGTVSGPIIFISILPAYVKMLTSIMKLTATSTESIIEFYKSFSSIGIGLGISVFISSVGTYILLPILNSLFYIDLKVRNNEISIEPAVQEISAAEINNENDNE